ncbi:MAG TPA: transposase [Gaiellaceae bacterium]|nr:transposase [Gaiellaceae bacterium]
MPRRPPIDPEGTYHVGSRGSYGATMFADPAEHETFLRMYERVSRKYQWRTAAWALMKNHFHFVLTLTKGGLSEGMRELNGGFSRWRNEIYGQTGKGHLVRHAFFARRLETTDALIAACVYVDLNPTARRARWSVRQSDWCSQAATLGHSHPRSFHTPSLLLEALDPRPAKARAAYRELLRTEHDRRRQVSSPNDEGYEEGWGD